MSGTKSSSVRSSADAASRPREHAYPKPADEFTVNLSWSIPLAHKADFESLMRKLGDFFAAHVTLTKTLPRVEAPGPVMKVSRHATEKKPPWSRATPPTDVNGFCLAGYLRGQKKELAEWANWKVGQFANAARDGSYYVQKHHRTCFDLYFKTKPELDEAAARAPKEALHLLMAPGEESLPSST